MPKWQSFAICLVRLLPCSSPDLTKNGHIKSMGQLHRQHTYCSDYRVSADRYAVGVSSPEPFDLLLRKQRHETKSGRQVSLDTRVDSYWSWTLPFSPNAFGRSYSTAPPSALVTSADLRGCRRAHATK